jgi:hypothetical protein
MIVQEEIYWLPEYHKENYNKDVYKKNKDKISLHSHQFSRQHKNKTTWFFHPKKW